MLIFSLYKTGPLIVTDRICTALILDQDMTLGGKKIQLFYSFFSNLYSKHDFASFVVLNNVSET